MRTATSAKCIEHGLAPLDPEVFRPIFAPLDFSVYVCKLYLFTHVNDMSRTMRKLPAISEAESVVMETIWRTSPIPTEEVVVELARRQNWQEGTVKTLLNRLLKKGAISADKEGRRYLYSPVLQRDEWLSSESKGLLDRLFGGRVAPLVAHFSKHQKLTKKDVADLKRLIEGLDHER